MLDREAIIASARAKRQEMVSSRNEIEELRTKLSESTETMRTIANLFSETSWRLLPSKIKEYFKQYR